MRWLKGHVVTHDRFGLGVPMDDSLIHPFQTIYRGLFSFEYRSSCSSHDCEIGAYSVECANFVVKEKHGGKADTASL